MGATGLVTDSAKNDAANSYATAGTHLTLFRALQLSANVSVGGTSFIVDLSVQAGDIVVFDQSLSTQEQVAVLSVTGSGPYTVTSFQTTTGSTTFQKAHITTGPNLGLQSHLPLNSTTAHEVSSITRVAANWGSPSPAGVITSSAGVLTVPGQTIGAIAVYSASTAGTYKDSTAIPGQAYTIAGTYQPVWVETFS